MFFAIVYFHEELKSLFKRHKTISSFSFFIIDDTLLEKVGKEIESAGMHYDHTKKTFIYGHQVVTSINSGDTQRPSTQRKLLPKLLHDFC